LVLSKYSPEAGATGSPSMKCCNVVRSGMCGLPGDDVALDLVGQPGVVEVVLGASLLVVRVSGEFHGVMAPTTPSGSREV
jgi:hypothetical protein